MFRAPRSMFRVLVTWHPYFHTMPNHPILLIQLINQPTHQHGQEEMLLLPHSKALYSDHRWLPVVCKQDSILPVWQSQQLVSMAFKDAYK